MLVNSNLHLCNRVPVPSSNPKKTIEHHEHITNVIIDMLSTSIKNTFNLRFPYKFAQKPPDFRDANVFSYKFGDGQSFRQKTPTQPTLK